MSGIEIGKAAASAGAWAWKLLENPFIDFLKRRWEDAKSDSEKAQYLQARWNEFDWGNAANRYKDRMKANYGYIRVLGTTEPKSLDDLFTDVHILEKPLAFRRFDIAQLHELQKEPDKLGRIERVSGLKVVVQPRGHRLYILGQPGAGKTTFLKYLVHQTTVEGLEKIPVFITIKDWSDSDESIIGFIVQQFDICQFPNALPFIEYILDSGKAVLLFDGLDEVKQENNIRTRITTSLHNFCKKYSETQTIVTCRVAASDYSFTEFTYVEISEFTDGQIQTYARKWFGKHVKKGSQFLDELNKPDNDRIKELGRSPLLLSLICLAYDETAHIPVRRVELYEEALDALLKKWDSSRNIQRDEVFHPEGVEIYRKLSLRQKKEMFARIATEAFEQGEIFFPKKRLARKIESYLNSLPSVSASMDVDGEVILRAIEAQHGILVERAQNIYSFSHLTFQEYYTATYIYAHAPHTLTELAKQSMDVRWREVFLLVASLLDEADNLFDAITLHQTPALLIQNETTLLDIQSWVKRKATGTSQAFASVNRSLYWKLAMARDMSLASYLAIPITEEFSNTEDLITEIAMSLSASTDPMLGIISDLSRVNGFNLENFRPLLLSEVGQSEILIDIILHFLPITAEIYSLIDENNGRHRNDVETLYPFYTAYLETLSHYGIMKGTLFGDALFQIEIPTPNSLSENWIHFEEKLRAQLQTYKDVGYKWDLSSINDTRFHDFVYLNKLMVDCLQVAFVRDREAILSKILTVD